MFICSHGYKSPYLKPSLAPTFIILQPTPPLALLALFPPSLALITGSLGALLAGSLGVMDVGSSVSHENNHGRGNLSSQASFLFQSSLLAAHSSLALFAGGCYLSINRFLPPSANSLSFSYEPELAEYRPH